MDEPTLYTLIERLARLEPRLARLEREIRGWRRATAAILTGIAGVLLMGQALPTNRTLEVQQLLLKDSAGRTRAELTAARDSGPELVFVDTLGRRKAALGLSLGEPHLHLFGYDRYGHVPVNTARVELTRDGSSISLSDARGKQLSLRLFEDASSISFSDVKGRSRLALTLDDESVPTVTLRDANARVRAELGLLGEDPFIALRDAEGNQRVQLSHAGDRSALLLLDGEEQKRAALGLAPEGPLLHLAGVQGNVSLGTQPGVLELRDAAGTIQSELTIGVDGVPRLELYDRDGIQVGPGRVSRTP